MREKRNTMRSTTVKKGSTRAAHRSLFYAMGYTEEELKKPLIGICNAQNEIIPGHMDLDRIAKAVKYGVLENGGTPIEFPAIGICDGILWPAGNWWRTASKRWPTAMPLTPWC